MGRYNTMIITTTKGTCSRRASAIWSPAVVLGRDHFLFSQLIYMLGISSPLLLPLLSLLTAISFISRQFADLTPAPFPYSRYPTVDSLVRGTLCQFSRRMLQAARDGRRVGPA